MPNLDILQIPWPDKWTTDPQIAPVISFLDRYLYNISVVLDNGEAIENVVAQQTAEDGGNRTHRYLRDDMDEVNSHIVQLKRQNRALEQEIYELKYLVSQTKHLSRQAEQNINDLTERLDSGS